MMFKLIFGEDSVIETECKYENNLTLTNTLIFYSIFNNKEGARKKFLSFSPSILPYNLFTL